MRRTGRSRTAMAVNAVRRHRRRLAKRGEARPSISSSAVVAVREAQPRTLGGLAAQVTAVGAMDTTAAAWRHRVALAPIAATAAVGPAVALWPGPTAAGLAVTGLAGWMASRADHPARRRRRGLAAWAGGALLWTGAGAVGVTGGLVWWQDLLVLAGAAAPGALAWWRPLPTVTEPAAEVAAPVAALGWIPPAVLLLGQVLQEIAATDRSPIWGAVVEQVTSPADRVAVAVVALPDGMHASQVHPDSLAPHLEAMLDRAGEKQLGNLLSGAVRVEAADPALGVTRLQVTASWSRALDAEILPWNPPEDLPEGKSWIGLNDAREDMVLESWSRGADGRVSVHHVWAIGRTGGGKSTTIRALVAPDLVAGREVLIPVDGKGTMGKDLIPFSLTGGIAKGPDAARQAVALAYLIFLARQARLDGDNPWMGPTPSDPIVTLFIDEYSTIGAYLTAAEVTLICEMARMARDLGVRILQSGQIPLVDSLIGGSEYRGSCRIVLGHSVLDATHDRIATQSGGGQGPSLLGLPTGRAVVLIDGQLVANQARIAFVTDQDLIDRGASRAELHPDDLTDDVQTLLRICEGWGTSKPAPVVDIRGLLAEWTDTTIDTTIDLTDNGGRAGTLTPVATGPAAIPAQTRTTARGSRAEGRLRQILLTHVLTHAGLTRVQVRDHAIAAGFSSSGAYKEIVALIDGGSIREDGGRLTATLWDQVPAAAGGDR